MTHYEYFVCIVFHELELVTSLPVIIFFKDFNIIKLIIFTSDHTSFVLNVIITICLKNFTQAVNLIKFFCFVITNCNISFTITVNAKVKLAL